MRFGRLEPISVAHHLERFSCDGGDSLDRYLCNEALTAHDAGMARTHVWVDNTPDVVGYATVMPVEVAPGARDVPRSALGSRKAVPGYLIAKMGISQEYQRQGHGRDLLIWTLQAIVNAADLVGGRLILVEAGGPDLNGAHAFYRNLNFEEIPSSYTLWMHLDVARNALQP